MDGSRDLNDEARAWGVETDYFDAMGTRRAPGADALRAILDALTAGRDGAPPTQVHVVRRGRGATIPNPAPRETRWLLLADGEVVGSGPGGEDPVPVAADMRFGSYRLVVSPPDGDTRLLLVSPESAREPEAFRAGARLWALAAQLYAIRSRRNWGIGDFTDLAHLIRIAAGRGAAAVGLNPLHAPAHRTGNPSPYAPNSRLFLNPLYIDLEAVPEFPGLEPGLADAVARLRAADMVDYAAVAEVKTEALRLAFAQFERHGASDRRDDFAAFRAERREALDRFTAFETLRTKFGSPGWEWPADWRRPNDSALGSLQRSAPDEMEFHAFVQWLADRQLAACAQAARDLGMPIGLYLDVAVGVEPDSADVWGDQSVMLRDLSIGAPPDLYNTAGQNWGLAAVNATAIAASDFGLFREALRAVMRHAGAIRLDHVLGLNRVFVIPAGHGPSDGTYVRFPLEAMLAVVAQESTAARCLVIGEDLGTVPDGLREVLADWNIWFYRVMLFERDGDGSFRAPERYPPQALVCFGTHDLPSFAGWVAGHDLAVRRRLGIDPGESEEAREDARRRMAEAVGGAPTLAQVIRFLARTPSRLLAVALEDILGVVEQTNVPATTDQHPNWRRRLPVDLDALAADPRLAEIAAIVTEEGRAGRRA